MGPTFKVVENKGADFAAWLRLRGMVEQMKRGNTYVKAGVVGPQAEADHGGLTNALLAMYQEFGTDKIPARSFVREPFAEHKAQYLAGLRELLPQVVEGKMTARKALGLIGLKMSADMKAAIIKGIPPPNAESTIAAKGSSTPLIDTGKLLSSISHEVVVAGAK